MGAITLDSFRNVRCRSLVTSVCHCRAFRVLCWGIMLPKTPTFRVFVSSTFEDLQTEREALRSMVFPKLRVYCERNGARFQAVDLRWGVREESSLDHQTVEICLREIRRSQSLGTKPNFLILLGSRYGWLPLPARIPETEFDRLLRQVPGGEVEILARRWYQIDRNAIPAEYCLQRRTGEFVLKSAWTPIEDTLRRAFSEAGRRAGLSEAELVKYKTSATEQEVLLGLGETEADRPNAFAFFRPSSGSPDKELDELKATVRNRLLARARPGVRCRKCSSAL